MKKIFAASLAASAMLVAASVQAQPVELDPVWEQIAEADTAAAPAYFRNDNLSRSGSINLGTTLAGEDFSVLVASRSNGNNVRVLNGSDGTLQHVLDNAGITGGVFVLNAVVAAPDGEIYLSNLVNTAGSGAGLKVYRYADDAPSVAPTNIADDTFVFDHRQGDTINVAVSGNDRSVVVTGNNAATRTALIASTDGGTSWTTSQVGPTRAALGIALSAPGGDLFLKGTGDGITTYAGSGTTAGTVYDGTNVTGLAVGGATGIAYYEDNGTTLLGLADYNGTPQAFVGQIIDITNPAEPELAYVTAPAGAPSTPNPNINGVSSISIARVNGLLTVYTFAGNNHQGVFQEEGTPPTSVNTWSEYTY